MTPQLERAIDASKHPSIADLDISMFSTLDVVNFILQRSEVLADLRRPGRIIKAWTEGDTAPILSIASSSGDELIRRAIGFIYLEFEEIRPLLSKLPSKSVADIGCGYAVFDYFLAKEFGSKVTLIDLETNNERHFGFKNAGAAYSNLDRAREFLEANGIDQSKIETINPQMTNVFDLQDIDLAVSFISCGFHYPWQTYEAFFRNSVRPSGSIVLDVRKGRSASAQKELAGIGDVKVYQKAAQGGADRLWLKKAA